MTIIEPLAAGIERLLGLFPPLRLRYCPFAPTARQEAFLRLLGRELFFGGGAGGGKSVALLMAALQYVDVPGYHALILRTSLAELQLPGGLIRLAHEWLDPTDATWTEATKTWEFPSGATLTFGYLADEGDINRYAGNSYSFIGYDELTTFEEIHYRRMTRALRQPLETAAAAPDGTRLAQVPVRIRSTSNPGGRGHEWVKTRFVDPTTRHPSVVFLPSLLTDNPYLDLDSYAEILGDLPTAYRERLLHGNWDVPDDGELFQAGWFDIIEAHQLPPDGYVACRAWDFAATERSAANPDPDYTVGLLAYRDLASNHFYVVEIVREQLAPGAVETLVAETAARDGHHVRIVIEQEPGAAGKATAHHYKTHVLRGYNVKAERPTGDKATRAWPVAAAAEHGRIHIVRGRHTQAFLDEHLAFPHSKHDDLVDALSAAHTTLANTHGTYSISSPHKHRIDVATPGLTYAERRHAHHDPSLEHLANLTGATIWSPPPPGIITGD